MTTQSIFVWSSTAPSRKLPPSPSPILEMTTQSLPHLAPPIQPSHPCRPTQPFSSPTQPLPPPQPLPLPLVSDLQSSSIEEQKQAAMEIRLLAKNMPENRLKIAKAGAIAPLISLLSSPDLQLQEYGVTAILNLSLCDENKELIALSGAIKPLVRALKTGTPTGKENAACTLLCLSQIEKNKTAIGRAGAIPLLVSLLENGGSRGKKDASTALYVLCSVKENKMRTV